MVNYMTPREWFLVLKHDYINHKMKMHYFFKNLFKNFFPHAIMFMDNPDSQCSFSAIPQFDNILLILPPEEWIKLSPSYRTCTKNSYIYSAKR